MTDTRARIWSFIAYPDSLPDDWLSVLEDEHVPMAVSPLHNLDVNEDGSSKKQHYHILLGFDGKKSYSQVQEISSRVNASFPIAVNSCRSYYRYLCHLDSLDKPRYDVNDIILLSGFNPQNYIEEQTSVFVQDMMNFIIANNVTSFTAFTNYCFQEHYNDWFQVLMNKKTLFFITYIRSRSRHE